MINKKQSPQQRAKVRVCASCEWVFKRRDESPECPMCGFGSYGARWVYGPNCYNYLKTQKPWRRSELMKKEWELDSIIRRNTK